MHKLEKTKTAAEDPQKLNRPRLRHLDSKKDTCNRRGVKIIIHSKEYSGDRFKYKLWKTIGLISHQNKEIK